MRCSSNSPKTRPRFVFWQRGELAAAGASAALKKGAGSLAALARRAKEVKREEKVQKANGMAMAKAILVSGIIVTIDHQVKEWAKDLISSITITMMPGVMVHIIVGIQTMVTIGVWIGNKVMG